MFLLLLLQTYRLTESSFWAVNRELLTVTHQSVTAPVCCISTVRRWCDIRCVALHPQTGDSCLSYSEPEPGLSLSLSLGWFPLPAQQKSPEAVRQRLAKLIYFTEFCFTHEPRAGRLLMKWTFFSPVKFHSLLRIPLMLQLSDNTVLSLA